MGSHGLREMLAELKFRWSRWVHWKRIWWQDRKGLWRVLWEDDQGRRCTTFSEAGSELGALMEVAAKPNRGSDWLAIDRHKPAWDGHKLIGRVTQADLDAAEKWYRETSIGWRADPVPLPTDRERGEARGEK